MTEQILMAYIRQVARELDLAIYHTRDSRGSDPGFPDLLIVGKTGIFRELKPDEGDLRWHQRRWFRVLRVAGYSCEIWRPRDWQSGRIRRELEILTPPAPPVQLDLFEEAA